MENARDLARSDPWRESAARSRARRGAPRRSSRRVGATRSGVPGLGPRGVAALALLTAIIAGALAGGAPQDSPAPARADVGHAAPASVRSGPQPSDPGSSAGAPSGWASCPLAIAPQGYVNPLAGAVVKPERIDQGVDYAGQGTLAAIGTGLITFVGTSATGWPGAFIEYRLLDGADAGCYVYYAEGVIPADGLHAGQTVSAGQPLATIIPRYPTGIEVGWGAGTGTKSYAKVGGQWHRTDDEDNVASAAGRSFSALIAVLGGPPGKVEG